jgi:hypothetical protein
MGSKRNFILIAAAAIAIPATASAQETEHVFVTGAMQDTGSRIIVVGATQDREQRITVSGAAQDREPTVTVIGAVNDRRTASAEAPADRTLRTLPVVYEDEPAPAPAPAARPGR